MNTLRLEKFASHWRVTLARPEKRNALSAELVEALIAAFDDARREGVPLVVLRGEGPCFSAGFDMSEICRQSEGDLLLRFVRIETLLSAIARAPYLTLAFAHGRNFGAGVDLFGACHIRVAAEGTTFRMPGLKFGLLLGATRFARIVGRREASRILETASLFDAETAKANGFVERITDAEKWELLISQSCERAKLLPMESRTLLQNALDTETPDLDLSTLVRSASPPGIHGRIKAYLASVRPSMKEA